MLGVAGVVAVDEAEDEEEEDEDDNTVAVGAFGGEFSPRILSIEKFNCEDLVGVEFDCVDEGAFRGTMKRNSFIRRENFEIFTRNLNGFFLMIDAI